MFGFGIPLPRPPSFRRFFGGVDLAVPGEDRSFAINKPEPPSSREVIAIRDILPKELLNEAKKVENVELAVVEEIKKIKNRPENLTLTLPFGSGDLLGNSGWLPMSMAQAQQNQYIAISQ